MPAVKLQFGAERLMNAAVLTAPRVVKLMRHPIPEPGPGDVRVRLEGCGVCASNLPPWEGRPWFEYPMHAGQMGHEGWGVIDALGQGVRGLAEGDRVAFLSNHAYAEFDVAPVHAVVKLPKELEGCPFPGEPLGCAVNIFRRSEIEAEHTVAIVGVGFLGALLTQLARKTGARVIALSRRPWALEVARRMGAAETIELKDGQNDDAIERVNALTRGRWCDRVIEATGKQTTLDLAGAITRERGRLVIAGYHQDGLRQVNMQMWNWRGLDVINAHEREEHVYIAGIRRAIEAVVRGELTPDPLYTHTYTLEGLDDAFEDAHQRPAGFMKALILMQPASMRAAHTSQHTASVSGARQRVAP